MYTLTVSTRYTYDIKPGAVLVPPLGGAVGMTGVHRKKNVGHMHSCAYDQHAVFDVKPTYKFQRRCEKWPECTCRALNYWTIAHLFRSIGHPWVVRGENRLQSRQWNRSLPRCLVCSGQLVTTRVRAEAWLREVPIGSLSPPTTRPITGVSVPNN